VERRIVDAQFQTDSLHVRLFSSFGSIDAFDDLVNKLGLDVSGTVSPGGILAIGSVSDISTLQAVADASGSATVPIEVSAVSEQSLEALNASYAGIGFAFDPDNSTLWLTGNADLISEALPAVRSRFTRARDVTVDAVFVAYDQTSVDSFDTELAFNIGSGDASILSGKLPVGTPVSFFVDKLVASGSAAVLSRPSVTTSTGSSARFQSGASVPVIGSIGEEGEQDIAYRDTGVVVSVSPSLLPSGRIRLRITLEVSSVDGLGVSDNPTFTRRVVSSTVEVASGETVALSGLEYQDRSASSADRLFFPSRNSGSSSQSLAFFLTATYDY
jgi:Flp pilus assembly secretin CpaC